MMNKIIDDSKLENNSQPVAGGGRTDRSGNDVALGGDRFRSSENSQRKKNFAPEGIEEDLIGDKPDGSAQITLTFDQLMELLSKNSAEANKTKPEVFENETPPASSEDPSNPGTRVIFQSDEYESAEGKRSFARYDEDDIFNDEDISRNAINNIRQNSTGRTYTPISVKDDRFSLSEVEFSSAELPELRDRKVSQAVIPPHGARKANVPVMARSNAPRISRSESLSIEEYEVKDDDSYRAPEEEPEEEKKRTAGDIVRRVILVIALIAIAASGAYLVREYILHKQNEEFESEVSNLIIDVPTTEEPTTTKKSKGNKNKETTTEKKTTSAAEKTIEEQWAEIKAQYPSVAFPENMQLKYAKLYATNRHFVGYLEAPGTNLSLPIVQTSEPDESNSYLKKNFYGASTKYGCPFVSSYNTIGGELSDYNTVIFGHHMNDRTIFGALDVYKKIDGFKAAPIIHFNTLYKDYSWKVIAAFITNDDMKDDNAYKFEYSFINLSNDVYKQTFLKELGKRSLYDTGVDVNVNDRLLTLSTCSHEFDNARFVVVARMVRAGEAATVDVSKAVVNESPRFPQAYYNAKKQTNPYSGDSNWYGE